MGFPNFRYKSLIGGEQYEPDEENPMIGFRGCGRYTDPFFEECFAMELEAKQKWKGLGKRISLLILFEMQLFYASWRFLLGGDGLLII